MGEQRYFFNDVGTVLSILVLSFSFVLLKVFGFSPFDWWWTVGFTVGIVVGAGVSSFLVLVGLRRADDHRFGRFEK